MKKIAKASVLFALTLSMTSCATLFGGKVTAYQKTTPAPGQPQRQIRVGALVADVLLFWPSLAVDFATGAIYKPQPKAAAATPVPAATNSASTAN